MIITQAVSELTNATHLIDRVDALILRALNDDPRATVVALAETTGMARNTVHARLNRLEQDGPLFAFERRVDPAALGYPLAAFISAAVQQRELEAIAHTLERIPEVLAVHGLTGATDLLINVVARDADDLYRIAGQILSIDGIEKTSTALTMHKLVDYRITPLLSRIGRDNRSNSATSR